ncbi:MAG TPA: hypothetical protein VLZ29_04460 [Sulfurimonas sp.]|uniref:hypothetical protein n=1 Tax=Sulfurimonas sp. TaxID=2022749 RepID=UPI002C309D8E|nr:hypothetical protein [Sulfurimonas sp.]HUH42343.1 hypothetical protein [Sulfurimonas sp.]
MEKLNLTLTQKIAVMWLKNVDSSLFIFKFLKDLEFSFRALFYTGIIAFTIFALIFAGSFINFADAPGTPIWQLIGSIIFYGTIAGMALILTLESVLKLDVSQILADRKEQKRLKKEQKLQKWRLRNMNIFLRIFIYISVYTFFLFIIQISAQGAFIDLFSTAPNTLETQKQITIFVSEYDKFVKWYTFIYIISGLTLDYFVGKKRAAREVQHV